MSFRIDDILKDKKSTINEENANIADKKLHEHCWLAHNEQNAFHQNMLFERDRDKINNYSKPIASCMDYQTHYLPCIGQQSLQFKRHLFPIACQPVKNCCSRVVPTQSADKICSASYIYPEKIYSQTTYNHVLPLSFPIYNHYTKRRNQVRFSTSQTKALEHKFSWQKYLSPEDRKLLAYSLKLSDRQVKTWFQNRRAKWRRNASDSQSSDVKPNLSNPPT